jgi:hypothetical protein
MFSHIKKRNLMKSENGEPAGALCLLEAALSVWAVSE